MRTTERINTLRGQKHEKGAISGFDRALLVLGVGLKAPRKRTIRLTKI